MTASTAFQHSKAEHAPTTFMQERTLAALEASRLYSKRYNPFHVIEVIHFKGEINEGCIRDALQVVSNHHDSLRTAFVSSSAYEAADRIGNVLAPHALSSPPMYHQIVAEQVKVNLDIRLTDAIDLQSSEVKGALQQLFQQPFDLSRPPLLRPLLLKGRDQALLAVIIHHLLTDRVSQNFFREDLLYCYGSLLSKRHCHLPVSSTTPAKHARAERATILDFEPEIKVLGLMWETYSANQIGYGDLETYGPFARSNHGTPAIEHAIMGPELTATIAHVSRRERITPYAVLLTSFLVWLARAARKNVAATWMSLLNRPTGLRDRVIGNFVNARLVSTAAPRGRSWCSARTDVFKQIVDALRLQHLPIAASYALLNHTVRPPELTIIFDQCDGEQSSSIAGSEVLFPGSAERLSFHERRCLSPAVGLEWVVDHVERTTAVSVKYNGDRMLASNVRRMLADYITVVNESLTSETL